MKLSIIAASALLALGSAAPATAAQFTFNFATSTPLFGSPVTGNGVFTTSDVGSLVNGRTAFAITSISGIVNGLAIAAPTGSYGNYFTGTGAFLDGSGTSFNNVNGGRSDFFFQDSVQQYRVNTFSPGSSSFVSASSAAVAGAVPEASTWAMMLAGFGLLGFVTRRQRLVRAVA